MAQSAEREMVFTPECLFPTVGVISEKGLHLIDADAHSTARDARFGGAVGWRDIAHLGNTFMFFKNK